MENIKSMPVVGKALEIFDAYPRLSAWVILSVGIVGLLINEARDVGLTTGNWVALIIASILVSGLCIFIVSWEDDEGEDGILVKSETSAPAATEASSVDGGAAEG